MAYRYDGIPCDHFGGIPLFQSNPRACGETGLAVGRGSGHFEGADIGDGWETLTIVNDRAKVADTRAGVVIPAIWCLVAGLLAAVAAGVLRA